MGGLGHDHSIGVHLLTATGLTRDPGFESVCRAQFT